MGAVLIEVCGRCGSLKGEGREWTQNARKEWMHRCEDGVIGSIVEADPSKPDDIPSIHPKYLEPDSTLHWKGGYHWVACHKCRKQIKSDYSTEEANTRRQNFFNCECGEWQEWLMSFQDGEPLPLKKWAPFEWSRVPTDKEAHQRLVRTLADALKVQIAEREKPPAEQTVFLQPATNSGPNVGSPPPPNITRFARDAIENAMGSLTNKAPMMRCASCKGEMEVWVWQETKLVQDVTFLGFPQQKRVQQDMPMIQLTNGSNVVIEVVYHCKACFRDDVFKRDQAPPSKVDGKFQGAQLYGQWFSYFGTFKPDGVWNPAKHWRSPDAILDLTPIKAEGTPDKFVY